MDGASPRESRSTDLADLVALRRQPHKGVCCPGSRSVTSREEESRAAAGCEGNRE